jgi:hypothetical protein
VQIIMMCVQNNDGKFVLAPFVEGKIDYPMNVDSKEPLISCVSSPHLATHLGA